MAKWIRKTQVQCLASSTQVRCLTVAGLVILQRDIPHFPDDRFCERHFGCLEGKKWKDIRRDQPDDFAAFMQGPHSADIPYAEPPPKFYARVEGGAAFLRELMDQFGAVALIAHYAVLRQLHTLFTQEQPLQYEHGLGRYACYQWNGSTKPSVQYNAAV